MTDQPTKPIQPVTEATSPTPTPVVFIPPPVMPLTFHTVPRQPAYPVDSVLPVAFRGLGFLSGLPGTGKTTFATGADHPSLIAFFDFDDGKGESFHEDLHFGHYRNMVALGVQETQRRTGTSEIRWTGQDMYTVMQREFAALPSGRFTTVILDNIVPIEAAFVWHVEQDPASYGLKIANVKSGSYGGAYPGAHRAVSGLIALMQAKGIRFVIAISHMKDDWGTGGKIPNKYKAKGVEQWQQAAILYLTMIPSGVKGQREPAAIVWKEQLNIRSWDEAAGEMVSLAVLPPRLPQATMRRVRQYMRVPFDPANPQPGEVPTEAEKDPFSRHYSKSQLEYMSDSARIEAHKIRQEEEAIALAEKAEKERALVESGMLDKAMVLRAEGQSFAQIAKVLGQPVATISAAVRAETKRREEEAKITATLERLEGESAGSAMRANAVLALMASVARVEDKELDGGGVPVEVEGVVVDEALDHAGGTNITEQAA